MFVPDVFAHPVYLLSVKNLPDSDAVSCRVHQFRNRPLHNSGKCQNTSKCLNICDRKHLKSWFMFYAVFSFCIETAKSSTVIALHQSNGPLF